ncbi:MAG: hypothetical protein ACRCY3_14445 [Sphingorhabdus sp.]
MKTILIFPPDTPTHQIDARNLIEARAEQWRSSHAGIEYAKRRNAARKGWQNRRVA